ncbi:MAG: DNA (cytosine-5-)-methyltransferase [Gammaproteobacteria bacterium]|nr:DNA (cytosine-5-)-methyltransferase [Gammaproteobacteria bacterium]
MSSSPYLAASLVADMLSISKRTLNQWAKNGKLSISKMSKDGVPLYHLDDLGRYDIVKWLGDSNWDVQSALNPLREYRSIELFAGGGGLALGLEKAGFKSEMFNEIDKDACKTLRYNRPQWNVVEGSVSEVDFTSYRGIDFLSGGFPCQAFSYAGNKQGFEDTRGTMFFEFARAVKETQPKVFMAENVKGLASHDQGRTLEVIKKVIAELGYYLIEPTVLKAMFYKVPQKRERIILVAIRNDLKSFAQHFNWPSPFTRVLTLKDALKKGVLYETDVPDSIGQQYPTRKKEILQRVPAGGYWRDLPDELQREYMMKSYFLGGGKTGVARRLSWEEPSLTLTCAPAQKQTERCHPEETRPLTVREYARIQTFPDDWVFCGSTSSQYKQIGNAVPVNLAFAVGKSLIGLLNIIEKESQ